MARHPLNIAFIYIFFITKHALTNILHLICYSMEGAIEP
jgi:hypothetical protein